MGQNGVLLLGIKKYCVSKGLLCLYILKKVEIWSGVTIVGRRTRKDRATQPFDENFFGENLLGENFLGENFFGENFFRWKFFW